MCTIILTKKCRKWVKEVFLLVYSNEIKNNNPLTYFLKGIFKAIFSLKFPRPFESFPRFKICEYIQTILKIGTSWPLFLFKIGPFTASFFFIFIFSIQLIVNNIENDWIRTTDLTSRPVSTFEPFQKLGHSRPLFFIFIFFTNGK